MKFDVDSYQMDLGKSKKKPKKMTDRDISWIDFNYRVLACAMKKSNPLNERLNFLGITESNLDEFISVRFSNMYNDKENLPYKSLLKKIKTFKVNQNKSFKEIKGDIEKSTGYTFVKPKELKKDELKTLEKYFKNEIFSRLTPMNISDNEINLTNGLSYISVIVSKEDYEYIVVIPVLKEFNSFFIVNKHIVIIEDIIEYFLKDTIFINQKVVSIGSFRIIRDGSIILSHDKNKFIVDRMEDTIKERDTSKVMMLMLSSKCDDRMVNALTVFFKVPQNHVIYDNLVNNYRIFSYGKLFDESKSYKPFTPFDYDNNKKYYDMFDALDNEDILLHHPYDSYDTVIKFIQHAATDKNVESIRMTLYRVSGIDSPIVNALCDAAYNGKFVVALVEIKARFDEDNNIRVIQKLKKFGVNVILGDEYLKTHCKMCLVTRKCDNKIKLYSHVATGNYNEKTSKIYTDLSFMTSKTKIGRDLLNVFNILSGYSKPDDPLSKVFYAPVNLRKQLFKCIDREISYAKKGKTAEIFIKVNSLSDETTIDKLYEAADAGVNIFILVRGICSIIPRKHLKVKSIVGRFLEHSRIYYFKNNGDPEYYISSADLLTRNLDRRVETLINITDSKIIKQIKWIILILKRDEKNSFILDNESKWHHAKGDFDAHQWMIDYSDIKKKKKKW